jgi:regulatory protein
MEQEPTDGSQSPNSDRLKNRKPRARKPRKATPKSLENAAHYHLQRFASSSDNLRRVLGRRVERSARAHGTDRGEGRAAIEDIIARFKRAGLLDDAAYARGRALSLNRRGASGKVIGAKLREKGIDADLIAAAIGALDETHADPELAAAASGHTGPPKRAPNGGQRISPLWHGPALVIPWRCS